MKNPITAKRLKKIKKGNMTELLKCIEDLHWLFNEKSFDDGYKSCLMDMSVRSQRLAEQIMAECFLKRRPEKPFNLENLAKFIEEYFDNALNK